MDPSQRCFDLLQAGNADALRRLLEETPNLAGARDQNGVSLLMQALYRGQRDLAATIADKKDELDIFEAASLGRLEALAPCLSDANVINSYSKDGFTALHFACYFGQPEAVRLLIEKGAIVNAVATNATRVMPLHSAVSARNLAAARILLEHGAAVNARQQGGWVPIHAAAQNGDGDLVDLLLEYGADAGIANDDGKTPAMIAEDKGHTQVAAQLQASKKRP